MTHTNMLSWLVDGNYKKIITEYESYIVLALKCVKNQQWIDDKNKKKFLSLATGFKILYNFRYNLI